MRRAAGIVIVLLALAACGNKAALYLPPEQTPQQDSKPAPRQ